MRYDENAVVISKPGPPAGAHPLDDAAFLYFVRTTPLELGQTYRLDYYYHKPKNPLIIRVERRERMEMPDGTKVDCLVVQPVIGDRGIFAEKQNGRVWVTEFQTDTIAVLDPASGSFSTIALSARSGIRNAALDAIGRYWFIGTASGKIGLVE